MAELRRQKEIEGIETVGQLWEALQRFGVDKDTPVCDGVGEAIMITLYQDTGSGELSVEFA